MEFIQNIDEKEYEEFVRNHNKSHFMQSYYFGEIKKSKNFIPHYVGLKENNKLVCATLLLQKKLVFGYSYFYAPRGYIIDFNNYSLLEKFTFEIKKFAKKNKAIYVKIDPDIKRHDLDIDGNILGNDNYKLIDNLIKLGYKHNGYNINFVNEQPRFTFRLDLNRDFDTIYKGFHATTRKILNKKNEYNLITYKGTIEDINDFYFTMQETAKRENLGCSSINYYKEFYEIFNEKNMSDLWVVKVNINNLRKIYNDKIKDINEKINLLKEKPNSKTENKVKELENELTKVNKDLDNLKDIREDNIVLSSIMTVKYNDKVWTVHGGNSNSLRYLNANYWLYYNIIKDAFDSGYKIIDFFGTSGLSNPPKDSPIYGIHNFKKRLGGEYIEFIGEFDLITNKLMYFLFKKLVPFYRNMKFKQNVKKNT